MNPKMVEYERRMAAAMGVLDDARMQMQMQTPADDTLDRRQEKLALIRELRDTTQSRSTYDRCVAIVGESAP